MQAENASVAAKTDHSVRSIDDLRIGFRSRRSGRRMISTSTAELTARRRAAVALPVPLLEPVTSAVLPF
jgi:hypothetical protein